MCDWTLGLLYKTAKKNGLGQIPAIWIQTDMGWEERTAPETYVAKLLSMNDI